MKRQETEAEVRERVLQITAGIKIMNSDGMLISTFT